MTTLNLHNDCLTAYAALKARDPELTARYDAAKYTGIARGTPEHKLGADLGTLNEVAASFATGSRISPKKVARARELIAQLAG